MKHTYRALVARATLSVHRDEEGVRFPRQTWSINLHLARVSATAIFTIPFILVFVLRGCGYVEEPAFRRVPLDLLRVVKREVGEPDFTKHCLLERRRDEGIELTVPARQGGEEDSDRFVVELVRENDFSTVLNNHLVIPCVNGASYFKVSDQAPCSCQFVHLLIKANLRVSWARWF